MPPWLFASLRSCRIGWLPRDFVAGLMLAAIAIPGQLATARLAGIRQRSSQSPVSAFPDRSSCDALILKRRYDFAKDARHAFRYFCTRLSSAPPQSGSHCHGDKSYRPIARRAGHWYLGDICQVMRISAAFFVFFNLVAVAGCATLRGSRTGRMPKGPGPQLRVARHRALAPALRAARQPN
jgi:hypothetical protein